MTPFPEDHQKLPEADFAVFVVINKSDHVFHGSVSLRLAKALHQLFQLFNIQRVVFVLVKLLKFSDNYMFQF